MEWSKRGEPAQKAQNFASHGQSHGQCFLGMCDDYPERLFHQKVEQFMLIITAIWFNLIYTELCWKNGLGRCRKNSAPNTIKCTPYSQTDHRSNLCQKLGTPAAPPLLIGPDTLWLLPTFANERLHAWKEMRLWMESSLIWKGGKKAFQQIGPILVSESCQSAGIGALQPREITLTNNHGHLFLCFGVGFLWSSDHYFLINLIDSSDTSYKERHYFMWNSIVATLFHVK